MSEEDMDALIASADRSHGATRAVRRAAMLDTLDMLLRHRVRSINDGSATPEVHVRGPRLIGRRFGRPRAAALTYAPRERKRRGWTDNN